MDCKMKPFILIHNGLGLECHDHSFVTRFDYSEQWKFMQCMYKIVRLHMKVSDMHWIMLSSVQENI